MCTYVLATVARAMMRWYARAVFVGVTMLVMLDLVCAQLSDAPVQPSEKPVVPALASASSQTLSVAAEQPACVRVEFKRG